MGLDKRAGEPLNKMHTWDVTFPQQTPNTTLAFVHIAPSTTIVYNLAGSDIYTYATIKISTLWKRADAKATAVDA